MSVLGHFVGRIDPGQSYGLESQPILVLYQAGRSRKVQLGNLILNVKKVLNSAVVRVHCEYEIIHDLGTQGQNYDLGEYKFERGGNLIPMSKLKCIPIWTSGKGLKGAILFSMFSHLSGLNGVLIIKNSGSGFTELCSVG